MIKPGSQTQGPNEDL